MKNINTDNLKLWIADLRSGKYQQGQNCLESVNYAKQVKNCCLGVLCRTAMANGISLTVTEYSGYNSALTFDGYSTTPPKAVHEWIGWDNSINGPEFTLPCADSGDYRVTLIEMNDTCGMTFSQIADFLEWYFQVK